MSRLPVVTYFYWQVWRAESPGRSALAGIIMKCLEGRFDLVSQIHFKENVSDSHSSVSSTMNCQNHLEKQFNFFQGRSNFWTGLDEDHYDWIRFTGYIETFGPLHWTVLKVLHLTIWMCQYHQEKSNQVDRWYSVASSWQ